VTATTVEEHFQRIPYLPPSDGRAEMHSGLSRHYPILHGNLVAPVGYSRDIGVVMAHPASNFLSHFLLDGFAEAGIPIMGMNTRYSANEAALIMERAAEDLGAGVRWMKEELGFSKVVLLGFSGGGSLSAFYQSEAECPSITRTPAGDPVELGRTPQVPADGLMLVGAHAGRAHVLRHWIDPSVVDELNPSLTDPGLDLYAPDRVFPMERDRLAHYRAAQTARIERIDAWALEQLEHMQRTGDADRAFVVHRTVADPRFLDLSLDPSDRVPGSMYGDPRNANTAAGGLARFCTVRSWLSTWSSNRTAADAIRNLPNVQVPAVVMCLMGDQAAFPSESRAMHAALPPESELIEMPELNHYLVDQPTGVDAVVTRLRRWLVEQHLMEPQETGAPVW